MFSSDTSPCEYRKYNGDKDVSFADFVCADKCGVDTFNMSYASNQICFVCTLRWFSRVLG